MSNVPMTTVPRSSTPTSMDTDGVARQALDGVAASVQRVHDETLPRLDAAVNRADAFIESSRHQVRHAADVVREKARHSADVAESYVHAHPLKSVLWGVAGGAVLMALATMAMRGSHSRYD